jgi:hypothetical protein
VSDDTDSKGSTAIGAGIGLGVGLGGGWGIVMASLMDGDVATGLVLGAGAGLVIALVTGATVYRLAVGE